MRDLIRSVRTHLPWLLLLLGSDAFSILLLWVADAQAFWVMAGVILLASLLLFAGLVLYLTWIDRRRIRAFAALLREPEPCRQKELIRLLPRSQGEQIRLLSETLCRHIEENQRLRIRVEEYEGYVESWAHETKTPLSLLTFLLDHRREELPQAFAYKLDYIRMRIQESIDQMLFYARIKSARKDYLFEWIRLNDVVEEVLDGYLPLLEEKRFRVVSKLGEERVYSDRRGVRFLLGQLVSNSIKYSAESPELVFELRSNQEAQILTVRDNGIGVRSCDVPFLFEKGFTGDSGSHRGKATGMGLYLAGEIAKDLRVTLEAKTQWGNGFEMRIRFPRIRETDRSGV